MFQWWHKVVHAHRSADETARGEVMEFIFPRPCRGFFIRMGIVALSAALLFGVFLMPCIIDGESMMPTYRSHGFTFCKRWSYWFSSPERSDVVIINYAARQHLLKRVVALAGDTVEFRNGELFVNGEKQHEPYLHYISNWNLKPRTVSPGCCYVVGDNRSQRMEEHIFGEVSIKRIKGKPLF